MATLLLTDFAYGRMAASKVLCLGKHSVFCQVQQLASAGVDLCTSLRKVLPKKHLLRQMAQIGAGGKHLGVEERCSTLAN